MKKTKLYLLLIAVSFCFNEARGQTTNTESFDGTTFPPNGWANNAISGGNVWDRVTTGTNPTIATHNGAGMARWNSDSYRAGRVANLVTPAIDWSSRGGNTPTLSLWWVRDVSASNTNGYNGEGITIWVNTSPVTTGGTQIGFIPRRGGQAATGMISGAATTITTGWNNYVFNIPAGYSGVTNYIIFQATSQNGNNCFLDDVQWISYPCTPPSNPTGTITPATNPACTSTTLSYSGAISSIYWETSATGTSTTFPTTSPFTVASSGTYYVRAFNGTCWSTNSLGPSNVTITNPPSIGTQPTNQTANAGQTATFTVTASNAASYQWQVSTDNGTNWNPIGTNASSYTTAATTVAMNGYQYRVIVNPMSPCATAATSNAATLTVIYQSAASDYFRSKATGNWNSTSTWESSPDGTTWYAATSIPTSAAKGITIRNGHTVTMEASSLYGTTNYTASNLVIDNGGTLVDGTYSYVVLFATAQLTVSNGVTNGFDFVNNGTFQLNGSQPTFTEGATAQMNNLVDVENNLNGIGTGTSDDFAYSNVSVYFTTGAVFLWNNGLLFSSSGVTYFPNSIPGIIPIFRVSANLGLIGGNSATTINGKFEVTSGKTVTFINSGDKVFRDGIGGAGTILHLGSSSGSFKITGTNAVIYGTPTITIENSASGTYDFEISGATTITGSPTITIGTNTTATRDADLGITGTLTNNGSNSIDLSYGNMIVNGYLNGTGTLKGTSTYTDVTVGGSTGDNAGVLRFVTGSNIIKTFMINRTGTSGEIDLGNDLTVNTATTLTSGAFAISGYTLTLNGTETATNGTLSGSQTSGLIIGGTANSLYFTQSGFSNYLKILTINASGAASLKNALNITASDGVSTSTFGTITVNGSLSTNDLSTDYVSNMLTLKSDQYGTAQLGMSSGTISGNAVVENYIPARKCWILLASGPYSDMVQTINAAWQEGNSNQTSNCSLNGGTPGYGTILFNGNPILPLYDFVPSTVTLSNIKTFTAGGASFLVPPSTAIALSTNQGYYWFAYGDRRTCTSGPVTATATTLRTKGKLNTGNIAIKLTGLTPGKYYLVKNPYASSVNLANVTTATRSNGIVADMVEIWDQNDPGTYGYGKYVTAQGNTIIGATTTYQDAATVNILQSGHAFIIQAISTTATLNFIEGDKVSTEFPGALVGSIPSMNINLLAASTTGAQNFSTTVSTVAGNNALGDPLGNDQSGLSNPTQVLPNAPQSVTPIDGVAIRLANDSSIVKLANTSNATNLFLQEGSRSFAIQNKAIAPTKSDTFALELTGLSSNGYALSFDHQQYFNRYTSILIDKYLGIDTSITDGFSYQFAVTSDTNSYKHRFLVVINGSRRQRIFPRFIKNDLRGLVIYPNPVHDVLKIMGLIRPEPATIVDMLGRIRMKIPLVMSNTIDVSRLGKGNYVLHILGEAYEFEKD